MVDALPLLVPDPSGVVGNREKGRGNVTHNIPFDDSVFLLNCKFEKNKVRGL